MATRERLRKKLACDKKAEIKVPTFSGGVCLSTGYHNESYKPDSEDDIDEDLAFLRKFICPSLIQQAADSYKGNPKKTERYDKIARVIGWKNVNTEYTRILLIIHNNSVSLLDFAHNIGRTIDPVIYRWFSQNCNPSVKMLMEFYKGKVKGDKADADSLYTESRALATERCHDIEKSVYLLGTMGDVPSIQNYCDSDPELVIYALCGIFYTKKWSIYFLQLYQLYGNIPIYNINWANIPLLMLNCPNFMECYRSIRMFNIDKRRFAREIFRCITVHGIIDNSPEIRSGCEYTDAQIMEVYCNLLLLIFKSCYRKIAGVSMEDHIVGGVRFIVGNKYKGLVDTEEGDYILSIAKQELFGTLLSMGSLGFILDEIYEHYIQRYDDDLLGYCLTKYATWTRPEPNVKNSQVAWQLLGWF